jgi:hypothetical protein
MRDLEENTNPKGYLATLKKLSLRIWGDLPMHYEALYMRDQSYLLDDCIYMCVPTALPKEHAPCEVTGGYSKVYAIVLHKGKTAVLEGTVGMHTDEDSIRKVLANIWGTYRKSDRTGLADIYQKYTYSEKRPKLFLDSGSWEDVFRYTQADETLCAEYLIKQKVTNTYPRSRLWDTCYIRLTRTRAGTYISRIAGFGVKAYSTCLKDFSNLDVDMMQGRIDIPNLLNVYRLNRLTKVNLERALPLISSNDIMYSNVYDQGGVDAMETALVLSKL